MLRRYILFAGIMAVMAVSCLQAAEIHDAARAGDVNQVKSLIAADKTLIYAVDDRQRQPLHYAAAKANLNMVKFLVENGADINAADSRDDTPLLLAVAANNLATVKYLIAKGADITVQQRHLGALIDYAFYNECRLGKSGMTDYLISLGMDFDPDAVDAFGDPRIFLASWFGHSEMLEWLLKFKPNVNVIIERSGMTPLHDVIIRDCPQSALLLINHGIDIPPLDKEGNPAIRYAVERGQPEVVKALTGTGAKIDFVEPRYVRTLLHVAAINGYVDIAEQLIKAGCDINAEDKADRTPVFYAARYGNQSLAQLLIDKGANKGDIVETNYFPSPFMKNPPAPGGAVAWYLNHRGWAVKTADHFLIIDNEQDRHFPATEPCLANGFLNAAEFSDQKVYVLYTGFHHEIGNSEYVHKIKDSLKRVTYIHNSGDAWRGDDDDIIYMDVNQSKDFGDLRIYATTPVSPQRMPLRAYLCEVDGLTLYYCPFNTNDRKTQDEGYTFLKEYAEEVDIAFFPMPEPGSEDDSDLKYFMEQFHPKAVCLLDPSRREHLFPAAAEKISSWGYNAQICAAENPGDKFIFVK